ncbi:hypothetical protein [Halorussus sp. AFM4]|uniref:hypothetical protein n=1 Tax=Halorussus sp. AFM4 TaxID=3421651 RepID=UPI003EBAB4DE
MSDSKPGAVPAAGWPFVYLTVTALCLGLVVGLHSAFPGSTPPSRLVAVGVVGLYAAISAFHYYASVHRPSSVAVPVREL